MAKIVKSARGVDVDFDLLKIKQQIATTPKTTVVQAREDFIDKKFSRRVKKVNRQLADLQMNTAPNGKEEKPFVETPETASQDEQIVSQQSEAALSDEDTTKTSTPKRIIRNRNNASNISDT